MRLVGYRDGRRTIVAARKLGTDISPIYEAEDFWSDPYAALAATRTTTDSRDVSGVELVPAIPPGARVLCVGLNYAAHAEEGGGVAPSVPTIFGRWTASLAVSDTPVFVPPGESGLDWEGELAVIVGQRLWQTDAVEAGRAVFGFAAFNDMTARIAQKRSSQWTLGKNVDHSGVISDIVTADEVGDISDGLAITTRVNGEAVQSGVTTQAIFSVESLLAFISCTLTLNPGDVLATGTPEGVGYVRNPPWLLTGGDIVEVEVERVGSIRTRIGNGVEERRSPAKLSEAPAI